MITLAKPLSFLPFLSSGFKFLSFLGEVSETFCF